MVSVSSVATPRWTEGLVQVDDEQLLELMQGTNEASVSAKFAVLRDSASVPNTLRALYDSRDPLGTNIELWNLMNTVTDTVFIPNGTGDVRHIQAILDLTGKPMFELLSDIILSGELFEEWPGWVHCVLRQASVVIDLAVSLRETKCDIPGCNCARRQDYLRSIETTEGGLTAVNVVIRLLKQAWEHHEIFLDYDAQSWQHEHLREAPHILRGDLLYLLESATRLKQIQWGSSREYARLCFLCWFHDRDTDEEHTRRADHMFNVANDLSMTVSLLGADGAKGEDITDFSRNYVQVYYEPESICRRLRTTILRSQELTHATASLCILTTYFLPNTKECISLVLETKLLLAMCGSLDLPFTAKKTIPNASPTHVGYESLLRDCLKGIVGVMLFIIKGMPFSRGAKVLIEECDVPLTLSWTIRLSIFYATYGPNLETLRNAVYVNSMLAGLARDGTIDKKSVLHSTFQQALSREWYPVLVLLRKTKTPAIQDMNVLGSWEELGRAMGLVEDVERKRFTQAGKRCSLVVCRFYTGDPPSTLRTCAGCGEVKYHCKPCQTEDWKYGGHKALCKRIK